MSKVRYRHWPAPDKALCHAPYYDLLQISGSARGRCPCASRCLTAGLEQLGHFRRVARDLEAALFHDGQLGIGRVGAAGDQRTGVAHALAGRGAVTPAMKPTTGLLHVGLAPAGGFGFVRAADFANHDDGVGVRIVVEGLHHVDVLQAIDRVATDADGAGLAQADFGQLRHGFIRQRAGAADTRRCGPCGGCGRA
jgi:hypothetical protein